MERAALVVVSRVALVALLVVEEVVSQAVHPVVLEAAQVDAASLADWAMMVGAASEAHEGAAPAETHPAARAAGKEVEAQEEIHQSQGRLVEMKLAARSGGGCRSHAHLLEPSLDGMCNLRPSHTGRRSCRNPSLARIKPGRRPTASHQEDQTRCC